MADLTKTVEIIFGGKNELTKTIDDIGRSFGSLESMTGPLANAADSVLKMDAALAAMAIGGLAYAVKTAGQFANKFGEITTLIQATGAPIDAFKKNILDYSTTSVKGISDISQSLYNAISAGVDYSKSIAFVTEAEKLSVAGRAGLSETTKVLISTLNAYGASTDQAGKYSDIMFTTVRLGQTTLEELSSSLAMVTGLASTSGVPFEKLSAAIAALTVAGLPTSQAITGIRQALQNIIQPSGEAEKMAAKLGIQFNATALQTRGFEGVLNDAYKATSGNIGKMGDLFGSVESLNTVMILGADKTGKFKEALTEMGKSAGATQVAYDKVAEEFENVNKRLENSFKVVLIEIGEKLMPEYGKIAGAMGDLMKGIRVGVDSGAFDPLFKELNSVGASIAKWLSDISKEFPEALKNVDFTGLAEAFKRFGDAVGGLFDIGKDKPKAMAEAMQLLADSIESLVDITRGIGEVFTPLISASKDIAAGFNALDSKTKDLLGNLMGLSLQYKLFGPVVTIAMQLLGSDTEDGTHKAILAFLLLENGMNAIKVAVLSLGLMWAIAADSLYQFMNAMPGTDYSAELNRTGDRVKILSDMLNRYQDDLAVSSLKVQQAWDGADVSAGKYTKTVKAVPTSITTTADFVPKIDPLATQETQWKLAQAFFDKDKNSIILYTSLAESEAMAARAKLAATIPPKQDVTIGVQADGSTIEKAYGMILTRFPDGSVRIVQAQTTLDKIALDNVKKKIDDAVPTVKLLEIQATLDVAKIKADAEIVQKAIEWKAKLDIADVEANAKIVETAFKSIDNTITSAGTTLSSMLGTFAELQGSGKGGTSFIEEQVRQENIRRDAALLMQQQLTAAEIDNMKARTEALKRGDSLITINGAGLQPHLEAFMFEILKAIQIRANAEGQKFLVGI